VANQRRRAPPRFRTRLPTDAGAGSVQGTAATTRDARLTLHAANCVRREDISRSGP